MPPDAANTPAARTDPADWVDAHGDPLFAYAMRHVGDPELAEDLVQETLVAALAARESFSGRSSERTWLTAILKHKIVDHIRRVCRERANESDRTAPEPTGDLFDSRGIWKKIPDPWPMGDPAHVLEQREFRQVFENCLAKMPDTLAAAFRLRAMDEFQADEVCQVLDITPTNLWARLHRARLLLRGCLERNWFDGKAPEGSL
jgi:RNA polymerase sigma-70 factor (ECF subfamily)